MDSDTAVVYALRLIAHKLETLNMILCDLRDENFPKIADNLDAICTEISQIPVADK